MTYASLNVRDGGEGERRWHAAGRPIVPSLLVGSTATPILHRSQLAALLGLDAVEEGEAEELARDAGGILTAWAGHLGSVPFSLLTEPTPSRGRSLRNLTVNVFHPFELLPAAFAGAGFDWRPERDAEREVGLRDGRAVAAYASGIAAGWERFLGGAGALDVELAVDSPRGAIAWTDLLAQQRWHAAFHYRQLLAILAAAGRPAAHPFALAGLHALDLPAEVF